MNSGLDLWPFDFKIYSNCHKVIRNLEIKCSLHIYNFFKDIIQKLKGYRKTRWWTDRWANVNSDTDKRKPKGNKMHVSKHLCRHSSYIASAHG